MDETKINEGTDTGTELAEDTAELAEDTAELEDDGSFDLDLGDEDADDADGAADESAEHGSDDGEEADAEDAEFDFESEITAALADDEEDDEESEEKSGEGEGEPAAPETEAQEVPPEESAEEPDGGEESPEARELAELKKKYEKLERRSKDALKSLGIDETDTVKGLEQLAREQSDMSEEDYKKDLQRRDAEEDERARVLRDNELTTRAGILARIEAKKKADLDAIHAAFPSSAKYEKIDDIPNFERFKVLRDAGNTPEEAYKAVSPGADEAISAAEHKRSLAASKSHLKSVSGKNAASGTTIPRSEYKMIRSMLGEDVSDAEVAKYYKKVKGN